MLTYNQRYKPRTEREYTKSDLTVYDSAGNTALNTLKVYGKSEIVDGAIKSAGEGWSTVDLGTLTWEYDATNHLFFTSLVSAPLIASAKGLPCLCSKYRCLYSDTWSGWNNFPNNSISCSCNYSTQKHLNLVIKNTSYTDATAFKTAMSGVLLCYQLADPTQGNTIAIKTDNGSGINGTMATFATGTPLYGVSDTVRDVMQWDGSAGEVTKKCGKIRLANIRNWRYSTDYNVFWNYPIDEPKENGNCICNQYTANKLWPQSDKTVRLGQTGYFKSCIVIKDTDYNTVEGFVASLGDAELVYELATPTTEPLTQTENESIASLRTFDGTTHCTNNASTDMTVNYTIKVPTIS